MNTLKNASTELQKLVSELSANIKEMEAERQKVQNAINALSVSTQKGATLKTVKKAVTNQITSTHSWKTIIEDALKSAGKPLSINEMVDYLGEVVKGKQHYKSNKLKNALRLNMSMLYRSGALKAKKIDKRQYQYSL